MRTITALLLVGCCFNVLAQDNTFIFQGTTVNKEGTPIADVYVVNPRTLEKDVSRSNGTFALTVLPSDSLIFSHISYLRKLVRVNNLQNNSNVVLDGENIEIREITVSPNKMTDMDRAQKNLSFLNEYKAIQYKRMEPDSDPLNATLTEHNRAMRTEAASINLLPIVALPVVLVDKAIKKRKHRKRFSSYYSTRKQKTPATDSIKHVKEEED